MPRRESPLQSEMVQGTLDMLAQDSQSMVQVNPVVIP